MLSFLAAKGNVSALFISFALFVLEAVLLFKLITVPVVGLVLLLGILAGCWVTVVLIEGVILTFGFLFAGSVGLPVCAYNIVEHNSNKARKKCFIKKF